MDELLDVLSPGYVAEQVNAAREPIFPATAIVRGPGLSLAFVPREAGCLRTCSSSWAHRGQHYIHLPGSLPTTASKKGGERQDHERVKSEMVAEITRLEGALQSEKEQAARTIENLQGLLTALAEERDRIRDEAQTDRAALAAAEGVLVEARKQIEREAERSALVERRNQELSERVIAEAAKAQALAARVEDLEGSRR
jgi:hypothetical protein